MVHMQTQVSLNSLMKTPIFLLLLKVPNPIKELKIFQSYQFRETQFAWQALVRLQKYHIKIYKQQNMPYWGNLNMKKQYQQIEIKTITQQIRFDYIQRTFVIKNRYNNSQLICNHIHLIFWKDRTIPKPQNKNTMSKTISLLVNLYFKGEKCLIHCSAGIGRTGVLLSLLLFKISKPDRQVNYQNLFKIVFYLRRQRKGIVQTQSQYEYIFNFLKIEQEQRRIMIQLDQSPYKQRQKQEGKSKETSNLKSLIKSQQLKNDKMKDAQTIKSFFNQFNNEKNKKQIQMMIKTKDYELSFKFKADNKRNGNPLSSVSLIQNFEYSINKKEFMKIDNKVFMVVLQNEISIGEGDIIIDNNQIQFNIPFLSLYQSTKLRLQTKKIQRFTYNIKIKQSKYNLTGCLMK